MNSFKLGDLTVYPNHGVGKINAIEERELGSMSVKCYVVDMVTSGSKVFVPVSSALRMGLRNISSKDEVDGIYGLFKHKSPELLKMNWNKRYRCLQEKMKTGLVNDVALVISDLLFLKKSKGLSYGEDKLLNEAEEILTTELSIVEKVSKSDIKDKIYSIAQSK